MSSSASVELWLKTLDCTLCSDRLRVRICTQYRAQYSSPNPFPFPSPTPKPLCNVSVVIGNLSLRRQRDNDDDDERRAPQTQQATSSHSPPTLALPPSLCCCYCHPPLADWRRHLSLLAICEQLKSVDGVCVFSCCCCSCCYDGHAAGDCQTRRPWTM